MKTNLLLRCLRVQVEFTRLLRLVAPDLDVLTAFLTNLPTPTCAPAGALRTPVYRSNTWGIEKVLDFAACVLCEARCSARALAASAKKVLNGRAIVHTGEGADTLANRCRGVFCLAWAIQDDDHETEKTLDKTLTDLGPPSAPIERDLFCGVWQVERLFYRLPGISRCALPKREDLLGMDRKLHSEGGTGFASAGAAAEAYDADARIAGLPVNFCDKDRYGTVQENWLPSQYVPAAVGIVPPWVKLSVPDGFVALKWDRNSCFVSAGLQVLVQLEPLGSVLRDFGYKLQLVASTAQFGLTQVSLIPTAFRL